MEGANVNHVRRPVQGSFPGVVRDEDVPVSHGFAASLKEQQHGGCTALSVSITYIDHYQVKVDARSDSCQSTTCAAEGAASAVKTESYDEETVIRVFGRTPEGQSALVHVYGYPPYFFIKDPGDSEAYKDILNSNDGKYVHRFVRCRGVDFYGYRNETEEFVKIEMKNPKAVKRLARHLQKQRGWLPYEEHIPYYLHFLADYQLAGMDYMPIGKYEHRGAWFKQTTSINLEIKIHCNDIVVDACSDSESSIKIPSLKRWRMELGIGQSDPGHSPSFSQDRNLVKSSPDKEKMLEDWLHSHSDEHLLSQSVNPQASLEKLNELVAGEEEEDDDDENDDENDSEEEEFEMDGEETQEDLLKWDESLSASLEEDEAAAFHKKETVTQLTGVEHDNILERSPKRLRRHVSSEKYSSTRITIMPRVSPPSRLAVDSHESLRHYEFHHPPYFSNQKDAEEERNAKKKYSNRPRAWVSTKHTGGNTGRVEISPRQRPPAPGIVLQSVRNSQREDCATVDAIEQVDTGTRKVDLVNNVVVVRTMVVDLICKSTNTQTSNPVKDRIFCISAITFEGDTLFGERDFLIDNRKRDCDERCILEEFAEFVAEQDPDIITGWEIQRGSLGYILRRAKVLRMHMYAESLSRVPKAPGDERHMNDKFRAKSMSEFWIVGRNILNMWRVLRKDIKLVSYDLENVSKELLGKNILKLSSFKLYSKYCNRKTREVAIDYVKNRISTVHMIIQHLDIFTKVCEFAKLIGVDFFAVVDRGSQFRVEAVMIRVAQPQNYIMPSASRAQLRTQPALEEIALNMNPVSTFYKDPVAVLDYRSLYPSVVIGYNLCFSTFVGRILGNGEFCFEAGVFAELPNDRGSYPSLAQLKEMLRKGDLFVCVTGSVFVRPEVRDGVLPSMLREILDTRIEIKDGIKQAKKDERNNWVRVLDARQLALKMLANVTYGYTAASFSGRMPMSALADSIVGISKDSLQTAMLEVQASTSPWAESCPVLPKVVYGDSVVGSTQLLLKVNGMLCVSRISEMVYLLHSSRWTTWRHEKQAVQIDPRKDEIFTWTDTGWSRVRCIIRHRCTKSLFKIKTTHGDVTCTNDHSLLQPDGSCISPCALSIGKTRLLSSFPNCRDFPQEDSPELLVPGPCVPQSFVLDAMIAELAGLYISQGRDDLCVVVPNPVRRQAFLHTLQHRLGHLNWAIVNDLKIVPVDLGDAKALKETRRFWNHDVCNDGLGVPNWVLNSNRRIRVAFSKGFGAGDLELGGFTLEASLTLNHDRKLEEALVLDILPVENHGEFVYDLTTENHHFQAGSGSLIVHNTDSLFVHFENCKLESSFQFANAIVDHVTKLSPNPMKLQMEKIYLPCFLVTKKR